MRTQVIHLDFTDAEKTHTLKYYNYINAWHIWPYSQAMQEKGKLVWY